MAIWMDRNWTIISQKAITSPDRRHRIHRSWLYALSVPEKELRHFLGDRDIHLIDGSLGTSRELMRRLKVQGLLRTDDHKGKVRIMNSSGRQELIDLSLKLLNLPDYE